MKKDKRGGKRKGAGRKFLSKTGHTVSRPITMPPDYWKFLETIDAKNSSHAVRVLIDRARGGDLTKSKLTL